MKMEEIKLRLSRFLTVLDPRDLSFFAGIAAMSYGCWLIYPPMAFIVAGAIFTLVSLFLRKGG